MWRKIGVVALVAVMVGIVALRGGDTSGAEARSLVAHGARLLDVRSPEEFASGHLPGAVNIPIHQLEQRMSELDPQATPIVVYCLSGARSAQAASLLTAKGFAGVHDLGPMSRW